MTATAALTSEAAEASRTDLPRQVGPYTLFEPIGRGGMAELFLARAETELGATRLAVVKLILPTFAEDPKFVEMLVHEAKLAARLSHRHIVNVFDLGRDDGRLYIAMEYVEGFDLNALLRLCTQREVGLPAEHALGVVGDILSGLDYAHRKKTDAGIPLGIVHRDVSPSNILISYDGEVKLCDFGIAHANDVVRDASEALKGKAGYMSPEHAHGEPLDGRADVFAAGIILWELLAGQRLYRPRASVSLLEQARRAEIPPLANRGLPQHEMLDRIVRRALARERDDRYPTADAFARDLDEYLAKAGLLSSRLKLGEWLATTFGTGIIDQRRASESRLPKSNPPPRSSASMRVRGALSSSPPAAPSTSKALTPFVPLPPRLPRDLVEVRTPTDAFVEAFPASAAIAIGAPGAAAPLADPSLAGASMDIEPSSPDVISSSSGSGAQRKESTGPAIVAWARRKGYVSLVVLFMVAGAAAALWSALR
jgi:serine/threonine-protein kinase